MTSEALCLWAATELVRCDRAAFRSRKLLHAALAALIASAEPMGFAWTCGEANDNGHGPSWLD